MSIDVPSTDPSSKKRADGRFARRTRGGEHQPRRLQGMRRFATALTVITTLTLGTAAATQPASAMPLTIVNGDLQWVYLGQYHVLASDGYYYLADAYGPPYGGGRVYCWSGTLECWWDQHPWRTW